MAYVNMLVASTLQDDFDEEDDLRRMEEEGEAMFEKWRIDIISKSVPALVRDSETRYSQISTMQFLRGTEINVRRTYAKRHHSELFLFI